MAQRKALITGGKTPAKSLIERQRWSRTSYRTSIDFSTQFYRGNKLRQ